MSRDDGQRADVAMVSVLAYLSSQRGSIGVRLDEA